MKHFLIKTFWKRLIVGLLLIVLAVALGFALGDSYTGPASSMTNRLIFIVCVIGVALGGLAFIFLDWVGLLVGIGFVLVIALPQALPDPWNRYFSFLYLACLLGLRPLIGFLKTHQSKKKRPASKQQKNRRGTLRQLRMGLLIATGAIGLPWLFLDVPYKLFSALSLLPFPITLATICLFPNDIILDDKMDKNHNSQVEFLTPLIFSGFVPALRTLLDFNFLTWRPLLLLAGLLLIVITVLLLVFYAKLRQQIGLLLGILFLSITFCLGTVGQLNYLLDTSTPQQQEAVITQMRISKSSKSPDEYILTLITHSGTEMELNTSKEHYLSLSIGENVTVYTRTGGLGIPYAIAD